MSPKYKRILLKLSGETLGGKRGTGFDYDTIRALAESVISIHNLGVEVGIVIGEETFFVDPNLLKVMLAELPEIIWECWLQ